MVPTMKDGTLVRWRRRAINAKELAKRFQTPLARQGMLQVVATYKWLAKSAAKRKLAARLAPRLRHRRYPTESGGAWRNTSRARSSVPG
jgi:hypothetical protein